MQEVRKKRIGLKLILCFFLVAGACLGLTQGTKNAYAQEEVFILELVFDTRTGDIQRVKAHPLRGRKPTKEIVPHSALYEKKGKYNASRKFIKPHPLVHTWGSPGCIKIQTTAGTERICW